MDKLLPCPFCGGEADINRCGNRWQAWCRHCATIQMGEFYDTEADAIAAWNRRTQPDMGNPITDNIPLTLDELHGLHQLGWLAYRTKPKEDA